MGRYDRAVSSPGPAWRRSTRCEPSGDCVEVALAAEDGAAVRDSKNADGPRLAFGTSAWIGFIARVGDR